MRGEIHGWVIMNTKTGELDLLTSEIGTYVWARMYIAKLKGWEYLGEL